jgi:CheY-specific phosphatase CheX
VQTLLSISEVHIDGLRDAVENTLAMFCGEGPAFINDEILADHGDMILGVISLIGEQSWSFMLGLPAETASHISERFAGFEIPFDSDDMGDVIGELVNVTAGSIIAQWEASGVKTEMSLPMVMRGSDIKLPLLDGLQRLRLNYEIEGKPFFLVLVAGEHRSLALSKR